MSYSCEFTSSLADIAFIDGVNSHTITLLGILYNPDSRIIRPPPKSTISQMILPSTYAYYPSYATSQHTRAFIMFLGGFHHIGCTWLLRIWHLRPPVWIWTKSQGIPNQTAEYASQCHALQEHGPGAVDDRPMKQARVEGTLDDEEGQSAPQIALQPSDLYLTRCVTAIPPHLRTFVCVSL